MVRFFHSTAVTLLPGRIFAMARSGKDDEQLAEYGESESAPNPVWFKPIMLGLMILGLLWVIVFYLSNQALPVPGIGGWNLVIGFAIAFVGFLMTTRWR
jgi:hypothetical protein